MNRDVKYWLGLCGVVALATLAGVVVMRVANRNHPLVAYQRVHLGMTCQQVYAELGPPNGAEILGDINFYLTSWCKDDYVISISFRRDEDGNMTVRDKSIKTRAEEMREIQELIQEMTKRSE
jgi:hypothetical protein